MKPVSKKTTVVRKTGLSGYASFLGAVKNRIRAAQVKATLAANAELIHLYWDIGRAIIAMQKKEGWGAGVVPRLARDIANDMPEVKGFSERNLKYMIRFAREYGPRPIVQQPVAQLAASAKGPTPVPKSSPKKTFLTAKYAKHAKKNPLSRILRMSRFPLFSILARLLRLHILRGPHSTLHSLGEDL